MRISKFSQLFVLLVILVLLGSAISSKAYYMVIDVIQEKAGSVFFPHHRHLAALEQKGAGLACQECHHELNKSENQGKIPIRCTGEQCHPADEETAAKNGKVYIKTAFHNLCKKCHQAKRSSFPKAPTNCPGCHKRELTPFTKERRQEKLPD